MGYELGKRKDYALRRYRSIADLPQEAKDANGVVVRHGEEPIKTVKESAINWLNENLKAPDNLGYELNDQTKSRLFVIRKDESGTFRKMSLDKAGLKPGSREFWEASQMGDVFAYPSGSKEPVQIQATKQKNGRPSITFSVPLSAEQLIPAKQPNFFKRLMNRINKNWFKSEIEDYQRQVSAQESMRNEIEARDEKTCAQELEETRSAEKALEESTRAEKRQQELDALVATAEKRLNRTQLSIQYSEAIFEPEPKVFGQPVTEGPLKGKTVEDEVHNRLLHRKENGKTVEGFMTMEQYNDLTQIGKDQLDLDAIKLGDSDMSVSKSDFCSLAMFTCMSKDIALNTDKPGAAARQGYDPTFRERLQSVAGFTKEQAEEITALTGIGMFTTDTFRIPPRDSSGRFIKDVINVARRRTADALNAYKNGDLEPLGKLLANGVNKQAGNAAAVEKNFGQEFAGSCASSRRLIDMMNADPRLKEAALKAGMEPKNLQVVEGLGKLCELDEKACKANLELAQAARDGRQLSAEQKQQLAQDIVTAELAFNLMATENENKDKAKVEQLGRYTSSDLMVGMDKQEDFEYLKNNLPKGKMWYGSVINASLSLKTVLRGKPDSITMLNSPTGMENLQKTAAELVRQQMLAEKAPEQISAELAIDQPEYGGDMKLGDKGLGIMKEQGMLERETLKNVKKELDTGAKEKIVKETAKETAEKKVETSQAVVPTV